MNDSRTDVERSSRHDLYAGNTEDAPSDECRSTSNANATSLTFFTACHDGSINQMEPMSMDSGNLRDNDLDPPLDFDSFETAGPEEGEMEFNYASAWPDWIFLTSV